MKAEEIKTIDELMECLQEKIDMCSCKSIDFFNENEHSRTYYSGLASAYEFVLNILKDIKGGGNEKV